MDSLLYIIISFFFLVWLLWKSSETSIIVGVIGLGLYIASFIHGYTSGRESIRHVLDFMKPGLRWKVMEAEQEMYDQEDRKYFSK